MLDLVGLKSSQFPPPFRDFPCSKVASELPRELKQNPEPEKLPYSNPNLRIPETLNPKVTFASLGPKSSEGKECKPPELSKKVRGFRVFRGLGV